MIVSNGQRGAELTAELGLTVDLLGRGWHNPIRERRTELAVAATVLLPARLDHFEGQAHPAIKLRVVFAVPESCRPG